MVQIFYNVHSSDPDKTESLLKVDHMTVTLLSHDLRVCSHDALDLSICLVTDNTGAEDLGESEVLW